MMMYLLGIAPFVSSLSFSDLRGKELKIFLSSDTTEHTQKPQKAPKKLNN